MCPVSLISNLEDLWDELDPAWRELFFGTDLAATPVPLAFPDLEFFSLESSLRVMTLFAELSFSSSAEVEILLFFLTEELSR